MFAMLQGAWPRVTADGVDLAVLETEVAAGRADASELAAATDRLVREVLAAQAAVGMDLVTDGQVRWPDLADAVRAALYESRFEADRPLVTAWRAARDLAPDGVTVAQAIPGPYSLGYLIVADAVARTREAGEAPPSDAEQTAARVEVTARLAVALGDEIVRLVADGCSMVIVEEPAAARIGADPAERALFVNVSRRLLEGVGGAHAMLAVTGGSAHLAGGATIFAAPWKSLLVDLIAGPDNWHLVREAPGDRGIVCAGYTVLESGLLTDQAPELVWASQYAASANGRGLDRVGLANATRLADRSPEAAAGALEQLARAARYASMPVVEAVAAGLDERTIRDARPVPAANNRAARRRQERQRKDASG